MKEYILANSRNSLYKEKGSIFYSFSKSVLSIEEVKNYLVVLNKKFINAKHICYAYRIKTNKNLNEYFSDDGEPNKSAGLPILNILKHYRIINGCIFVVRTIGGRKLGIQGLKYAYGFASKNVISESKLIVFKNIKKISIIYPYRLDRRIKSIFNIIKVKIINEEYDLRVKIKFEIDIVHLDKLLKSIKDIDLDNSQILIKY